MASVAPEPAPAYDEGAEPAEAVLSLVPQSADVVTVVDWDQVRAQLGQPDLTSEDLMTDRFVFWERAATEAALLTDGLLREDSATFELDYGFTQDDVDWEARWTGEDGPGFALAFRPDLDLAGVRRAIEDDAGPLAGATLDAAHALVVAGTADEDVWANEETLGAAAGRAGLRDLPPPRLRPAQHRAGAGRGRRGPGGAAGRAPGHEARRSRRLRGAYGDHQATVRVEPGRADLFERLRIGEDWPTGEFASTYVNGAADPSSGRIGYSLPRPPVAAGLALLEELPFGVCDEVVPLDDPTGL